MFNLAIRPLLFGTLSALAVASAPASASAQQAPRQVTVSYSDLDLASTAGESELNRRVGSAVRRVCASNGTRDLKSRQIAQACAAETLANAQRSVQLAVNSAHSGQQLAQNGIAVTAGR